MASPESTPPTNTPTDPHDARPTEVRSGRRMPGMMTVLVVSVVALGAIYMAILAFGVGANEESESQTDVPPSELLDEAPPSISGEPAGQE